MLHKVMALFGIAAGASLGYADFTNSYSYTQKNISPTNVATTFSNSDSSTSSNFVGVTKTPTYSTLTFSAIADEQSASATNFSLKSAAEIDININASSNSADDQFDELTAQASSTTMLSDTVRVTGLPNGTTGFIQFNWALTGLSSLSATESSGHTVLLDNYQVDVDLSITAPGQPFPPFASTLTPSALGINNSSTSRTQGVPSGAIILPVSFTAGTDIPVDFTLTTAVSMAINPMDTVGFQFMGNLHADYDNTAVLSGVSILDMSMNPMSGVGLESTMGKGSYNVTAVPEPSAFALGFVVFAFTFFARFIKRRFCS